MSAAGPLSQTRVLTRAEVESIERFDRSVEARHAEATAKIRAAEAEAQGLKDAAWEEGFLDGRNEAFAALAGVVEETKQAIAMVERHVVEIVQAAARSILDGFDDDEILRSAFRSELRRYGADPRLALEVHPASVPDARDFVAGLDCSEWLRNALEIRADPLLSATDVVLVTGRGRIRLDPGSRRAAVLAALESGQHD